MTNWKKEYAMHKNGYDTGSFFRALMNTFECADIDNEMRLGKGFPELRAAIVEWRESDDPDALLNEWIKE